MIRSIKRGYNRLTCSQENDITNMAKQGCSVLKIRKELELSYRQVYTYLKQKRLPIILENPDKGYNHRMLKKANTKLSDTGFFDEHAQLNWII